MYLQYFLKNAYSKAITYIYLKTDLVIRVNASGDMVVEETLLSPPSDKTFCGRVYGILLNHPPTYIPDYSLYNDDRLAVTSSSVVLACDDATTGMSEVVF